MFGVAGLQRRHDAARVVAQLPCFVEGEVVAGADEASVARHQRQVVGEGGAEQHAQARVDAPGVRGGPGQRGGELRLVEQAPGQRAGGGQAVAQGGQVARAAAAEAQARQGAGHVGRALQRGPHFGTATAV